MRSLFFTAVIVFTCASFLKPDWENLLPGTSNTKNIFDLTVRRLSGQRVIIAWHTQGDSPGIIYEVLRKHKRGEQFTSLGVVSPELKQENTADYSFIDTNNFTDSSYYCLKKTNVDSVIFYSIIKRVEGVGKER